MMMKKSKIMMAGYNKFSTSYLDEKNFLDQLLLIWNNPHKFG